MQKHRDGEVVHARREEHLNASSPPGVEDEVEWRKRLWWKRAVLKPQPPRARRPKRPHRTRVCRGFGVGVGRKTSRRSDLHGGADKPERQPIQGRQRIDCRVFAEEGKRVKERRSPGRADGGEPPKKARGIV